MVMKVNTQTEVTSFPAGEFKAKCLNLMDEAVAKQKRFGITKRGKLVVHFVPAPAEEKPFRSVVGRSPGIRLPREAEWARLKKAWADGWDICSQDLASSLSHSTSTQR